MMKQRAPTVVLKVAAVPRLIVEYSRMMVPCPISTQVSSPAVLEVLRIAAQDRPVADPHVLGQPHVALQRCPGADAAAVAHRHLGADDGPRSDRHAGTQPGRGVDQRGRVDHRSTTRAIISASATTWPST